MRRTAALAALALGTFAMAQVDFTRTVATVNGEAISAPTYYRRMEHLGGFGSLVGDRFVPATPGLLTLQTLINEALMVQLAKSKGVGPTAKEIDDRIAEMRAATPNLDEGMKLLGMTEADLRREAEVYLSEYKVTTMGVNITDLEVEKHYNDNKTRFTTPTTYAIRLLQVTTDAKKQAVDTALAGGADFAKVAQEQGEGTGVADGSELRVAEADLGEWKDVLGGLQPGKTSEWVRRERSWVKVKLDSVTPAAVQPLSPELRREIRRELTVTKGAIRNNVAQMMSNMRKQAKLDLPESPYKRQLMLVFGAGG